MVERAVAGEHQLIRDGGLAGDGVDVVERVDVGEVVFRAIGEGLRRHLIEIIARQNDLDRVATVEFHGMLFHQRRRQRHEDFRLYAQHSCGECHALRMVARAGGDDGSRALGHEHGGAVIGAAPFIGVDRREIFALDEHFGVDSRNHDFLQRRRLAHVIDAGAREQDFVEQAVGERWGHGRIPLMMRRDLPF